MIKNIWDEMKNHLYFLQRTSYKDKKELQWLIDWTEKEKTVNKITYIDKKIQELNVYELVNYYQDFWKLIQNDNESCDYMYRKMNFIHEFPQRVTNDLISFEKRNLRRKI